MPLHCVLPAAPMQVVVSAPVRIFGNCQAAKYPGKRPRVLLVGLFCCRQSLQCQSVRQKGYTFRCRNVCGTYNTDFGLSGHSTGKMSHPTTQSDLSQRIRCMGISPKQFLGACSVVPFLTAPRALMKVRECSKQLLAHAKNLFHFWITPRALMKIRECPKQFLAARNVIG